MAYEQKPGTGAIFANDKKSSDSVPGFKGSITTPKGEKLNIAMWVKEIQGGAEFFSVKVSEPYKKNG